jgi:hypothetical protein
MKIHLRNIDRRAALLAGFELGSDPSMNASPADFGEHWPDVLATLDLTDDGAAICRARNVAAPTVEAVIAAVEADKAFYDAGWNEVRTEVEAAIEAIFTLEPNTVYRAVYDPESRVMVGYLSLLQRPAFRYPSQYDNRVLPEHRRDPVWARLTAAIHAFDQRIEAQNKATIEAALPRLREEKEAHDKAAAGG